MHTHTNPNPLRRERLLNLATVRQRLNADDGDESPAREEMLVETDSAPAVADESDNG